MADPSQPLDADRDDAGSHGPPTYYHRVPLSGPSPTAASETQPGRGESDGVAYISARPTLGPERRVQFRSILIAIRDGGRPLGPLVLAAPDAAAGNAQTRSKAGSSRNASSAGKALPAPSGADDRRWPSGPLIGQDLFTADEVQQIIEAILTDEEIMAHPTMPGLTRARLREAARRAGFEPNRFGRFSAALVLWFADAGVTVLADDKANNPWARPRPLIGNDRVEIRRRLRTTDPPDAASVAALVTSAGFNSSSL